MKEDRVSLAPDVEAQRALFVQAAFGARAAGLEADERAGSPLTEWVHQNCAIQPGMLALTVCLVAIAMNEAAQDESRVAREINALLKASGYPCDWRVTFAVGSAEPTDVRRNIDGHDKRLGSHGWGLLQSQGYALPPWECSGYARGRTGGAGVRLCTWCDKPEGEHARALGT